MDLRFSYNGVKKNPWGRRRRGGACLPGIRMLSAARLILAFWICGCLPGPSMSATLESLNDASSLLPWAISAEEVVYDRVHKVYIARNGVTIRRGVKQISADYVRFDHIQMTAVAEGNVVVTNGADVLTGKRIEISLQDETGVIYEGGAYISESRFYIRGDEIRKVGENDYEVEKAVFTSCDGDRPDWKITASRVDVTVEGYGSLKHGAMWVRDAPVFYLPFFFFPAKFKRQTGLLVPKLGKSGRRGYEYAQPFFWAVNEQSDATFYAHYMSDRGLRGGAEYRYVIDGESGGTVLLDLLDDRKVDDGEGTSGKDWGYEGDSETRPNSDRYWFRMKADQALPLGWTSRLDLDVVSDQDYLTEFESSLFGYDETRGDFNRTFGRDIDDENDSVRTNRLVLSRRWDRYKFYTEALWNDDVVKRRWRDEDNTLHRLPRTKFSASRQSLTGTPLFWKMNTEFTYFYRADGETGHRTDIHPRLYLPLRFRPYLSVEPSVGIRETLWYVDHFESEEETDADRYSHREMADARVECHTDFYRVFPLDSRGPGGIERLKHNVRPRLVYEITPEQGQEEYPYFDTVDRIEKRNRLTFSIVQTLLSRRVTEPKTSVSGKKKTDDSPDVKYDSLCRLELGQSYDFYEYEEDDDPDLDYNDSDWTHPETGTHFSPFFARLDLNPAPFLNLAADAEWSHMRGRFISRNLGMSLADGRGDRLYAEHRYSKGENESLYASFRIPVTDTLTAYGEYEKNIRDDEDIETGLGLMYDPGCWSVSFKYTKDGDDRSYAFTVNLDGLGGVGAR